MLVFTVGLSNCLGLDYHDFLVVPICMDGSARRQSLADILLEFSLNM